MLIGIDGRLWSQTGVGRYIRNLVTNLLRIDKKNNYVIFVGSSDFDNVKEKIKNNKWQIIISDIKWHSISEQTNFAKTLNNYNFDLVHFPYFSVPIFYRKKYVITLHDLIVNKFKTGKASTLPYPLYLLKRQSYLFVLKNALKTSLKVIVPSNTVRNDLLSSYKNIDAEKIVVTYEGGFEKISKASNKELIKGKYFLRIGNFYPHKNVENLLIGFKDFVSKPKNKEIKLVLVGKKDFFFKNIEEVINKLDLLDNIIFIKNPNDEDLLSLYKHAVATVIPSFMEGFSLTAVEAMSAGCLVLVSDIEVHREICKDAAVFFDPNNTKEIPEKLKFILEDSQKTEKLIQKGYQRVKYFSWENMAKETLDIYDSSISSES